MKRTSSFLVVGVACLAAIAVVCATSKPTQAQGVGEKVYKAKCVGCHGADGKGETPAGKATKARDLCSEDAQKETDEEWTGIVLKGKNKMPGYDKKISDAEVKDVVAYMRTLCKK